MKKFYLLLALVCATLTASATTKTLYSQNFELSTSTPADWKSLSLQAKVTVKSDGSGNYINFAPGDANDRSFYNFWGADVVAASATYRVSFDFNPAKWGGDHLTSELAVCSGEETMYRVNANLAADAATLFDLKQQSTDDDGETALKATQSGAVPFIVNNDATARYKLDNKWYNVALDIDTQARTVEYTVTDLNEQDAVITGSYTVPEGISMAATGIFYLSTRYRGDTNFDNIAITEETDGDFANKPTVALVGINNHQRVYAITAVSDDEEIHATFNGEDVTGNILDGNWSNNANYDPDFEGIVTDECPAGTLVVWTTMGTATSEQVSLEVSSDIIPTPAATATIANVQEGYAKTFKLFADGTTLPVPATVAFTVDGQTVYNNGTFDVTAQGAIEVVAQALGYGPTTTTIENNTEYTTAATYDYQKMTWDELQALPSVTAGEWDDANTSHWLGHYLPANYEGADNKPTFQLTESDKLPVVKVAKNAAGDAYENVEPFTIKYNGNKEVDTDPNVCLLRDEGLVYATTKYNNLILNINPKWTSADVTKPNFAVLTLTGSYDRFDKQSMISPGLDDAGNPIWEDNSKNNCHRTEVIATDAKDYNLYRFDTAINCVKIMTYVGFDPTAIAGVAEAANATAAAPVKYVKNGQIFIGNYNALGQQVK